MAKWADYLISAVESDATGSHISRVRVHADNGDTVGPGTLLYRATVVSRMESGYTFATITENSQTGKWSRGAAVQVVVIDEEKYLRTDPDYTKADNLGSLPRL